MTSPLDGVGKFIGSTMANVVGAFVGSKDVVEDITEKAGDVFTTVTKPTTAIKDIVVKYWYIPVIIGGVVVGYILVKKSATANPYALAMNLAKGYISN